MNCEPNWWVLYVLVPLVIAFAVFEYWDIYLRDPNEGPGVPGD